MLARYQISDQRLHLCNIVGCPGLNGGFKSAQSSHVRQELGLGLFGNAANGFVQRQVREVAQGPRVHGRGDVDEVAARRGNDRPSAHDPELEQELNTLSHRVEERTKQLHDNRDYLASIVECLGTKVLVADEMESLTAKSFYAGIAQDTLAMAINDLITEASARTGEKIEVGKFVRFQIG